MKTSNTNINDFGAKIGGARKDYFAALQADVEKFAQAANPETLRTCKSLGALVKLPNLEKYAKDGIITAEAARAVLALWRSIDRKPTQYYRVSRWVNNTMPILNAIRALLAGGEISDNIAKLGDYKVLTAANWPAQPFNFSTYNVHFVSYIDGTSFHIYKGSSRICRCDTAEEVVTKINALCEADSEKRAEGPALAASRNRAGVYYIHPAHNANICIRTLHGIIDASEIRRIMKEDRPALVARLKELQQFPELRRDWNRPRTGEDWRKGKETTPEMFSNAIPFRGVEFGNWVTQTERANLLNAAFDGFHDLAQIFGLTADKCALDGTLAFAFGSRGISSASAHYEPEKRVINLTKKNGAGCMAHEFFHAVDNWVMFRRGLSGYATEAPRAAVDPIEIAGRDILEAIRKTEYYRRSENLAAFKGDYWVKGRELTARAFEGVCAFLLKENGICSDFLVNCISMDDFTASDVANRSNYYPYPTEAEAAILTPLYVAFFRLAFHADITINDIIVNKIAELQSVAKHDQEEAAAKRNAEAEEERKQREEINAQAKDHNEAIKLERVATMTKRTAEVMAECGGTWSHVFTSGLHAYGVGGGNGFIFIVWANQRTGFRILKENTKIKKEMRTAHGYFLEYRKGLNIIETIKNEVKNGFMSNSFIYDLFRLTYADTWEEFRAKHAEELAAVQTVATPANYTTSEESEPQPQSAPTAEANDTTEAQPQEETEAKTESAKDLKVLELENGRFAVTGEGTFAARKDLRRLGGWWNKFAKRWEFKASARAEFMAWLGTSSADETPQDQSSPESVANDANTPQNDTPQSEGTPAPISYTAEGENKAQSVANDTPQGEGTPAPVESSTATESEEPHPVRISFAVADTEEEPQSEPQPQSNPTPSDRTGHRITFAVDDVPELEELKTA